MLPAIKLGNLIISSYAFLVVIGLLAFTVSTILILEKVEKGEKSITNRLLIISIFGFAALVFFAFLLNSIFHSIEKGQLIVGGITWLGGVIFAFPLMVFMIHKFCPAVKGEALKYFNFMIPGIVLAHGFGRIGCFLGGCCYGVVTDSVFGVSFPDGSLAAKQYPAPGGGSLPVLPSQLFEAGFEFLLFFVMIFLYKRLKNHFFETYAFAYGSFRFVLEFLRGDDRGGTGFFLTPSQLMSVVLIIGGVLVLLYNKELIFKKLRKKMEEHIVNRTAFVSNASPISAIKQLKELLDIGALTEEEFEAKKKELLERI